MTDTIRTVKQLAPSSGTTLVNLYSVTLSYTAVLGSINICNTGSTQDFIGVSIKPFGSTDIYLYYNFMLNGYALGTNPGNDVLSGTQGLTLRSQDQVNVWSLRGTSHFTLSVVEIS